MSDERRDPDRDDDSPSGVFGVVRQIVGALADAQRSGRDTTVGGGRWSRGGRSIEYGFSGRLGGLGGESSETGRGEDAPVIRETLSRGDETYLVDVRAVDEGVLVVADVPGVDSDDLTVRLTDSRTTIVVVLDGGPLGRIVLPWRAADVDPVYHHGVLEIAVEPEVADR